MHFPVGHPRRTLSVTLLCEARTFLTVIPFGVIPRDSAVCFWFIIPRLARNVKSLLQDGNFEQINGNEEGDQKVGEQEAAVIKNGVEDGMHILRPLSPHENAREEVADKTGKNNGEDAEVAAEARTFFGAEAAEDTRKTDDGIGKNVVKQRNGNDKRCRFHIDENVSLGDRLSELNARKDESGSYALQAAVLNADKHYGKH